MALRLAYSFDEGSGSEFNESSGGPSGTIPSGSSFTAGKNGSALVASNDNPAGQITGSPIINSGTWSAVTFMAWIKRASEGDALAVFAGGDMAGLKFAAGGSQIACWQKTESSYYEFSPISHGVASGEWMHVAWTWSATDEIVRLFVDGSEVASNALSGTTLMGDISSIDLGGVTIWTGANPFCAIDDFRVFDEALGESDIQSWMSTPVSQYTPDRCEGGVPNSGGGAGTTYSPGGNEPNMAFDNNPNSDWLRVRSGGNIPPVWLQYDFGIGYERKIARYTITTCSDTEAHDPMTWTLLASNTGVFGGEEVVIDSQTDGQLPSGRGQKKVFDCASPPSTAYRVYRLVITEQKNTGIVSATTLGEMEMMELLSDSTGPLPTPQIGGNTELPTPISEYAFFEGSGTTAEDTTGNGYDLTTSGGGWVNESPWGAWGGASEGFSGVVGPNQLQEEWTVMAWVKRGVVTGSYDAILSNSSDFYFELWRGGESVECYAGVSGAPSTGPNIIPQDTWTHVAATRRADGTASVFVNGIAYVAGMANAMNFGAGTWYIAGSAGNPAYTLDGIVSTLRVFDTSLTAIEIQAWMNTGPLTKPPTLLAAYAFNEPAGSNSIRDYSTNNVTATASGVAFTNGPLTDTRAISFSGGGQYVYIPRDATEPATQGVTVMCWAKGPVSMDYIVKPRGNNSTRMGIGPNWRARWKDDLHFTDGGSGVDTSQWHHYCVVDTDDQWVVFIDGVVHSFGGRSLDPDSPAPWENYPWCIGDTLGTGLGDSQAGQTVAEVRIFRGGMYSERQVLYYMNTPICPVGRSFELGGVRRPVRLGTDEVFART